MTVVVLLLVIVFLSLLVHIIPGDPAKTLLGPRASPELISKTRAAMDLDKPLYEQIGKFIWNVLHGNFGTDVFTGVSINFSMPEKSIITISPGCEGIWFLMTVVCLSTIYSGFFLVFRE